MTTQSPPRAFDELADKPCPVCLELAQSGAIQPRAVMPLPKFPALSLDGRQCCRDCQATDTTMRMKIGQHPLFAAARLTVANERIEGSLMPLGMMEHFGLCKMGLIRPSSLEDLQWHLAWLDRHGIPNSCGQEPFGCPDEGETIHGPQS